MHSRISHCTPKSRFHQASSLLARLSADSPSSERSALGKSRDYFFCLSVSNASPVLQNSNRPPLQYLFVLLSVTISLMAVAAVVYEKRDQATEYLQQAWIAANNDLRVSVQTTFHCCGLLEFNDSYSGTPCPAQLVEQRPCLAVLEDDWAQGYRAAGICGIVFSTLMLISIIGVWSLVRGIKNRQETERRMAEELRAAPTINDDSLLPEGFGTSTMYQ